MKKNNIIFATIVTLLFALVSCIGGGSTPRLPKMANEVDSMNYAYGLFNGSQMRMMLSQQDSDSIDFRIKKFMDGVKAGIAGTPEKNPQFSQLGNNVGGWLNQQKTIGFLGDSTLKIDYALVKQGIINGIKGKLDQMNAEDAQTYLEDTMRARHEQQMLKQYGANKEAGEKFLTENKAKEGIKTTESGLQYEVVKEGTGAKPTASDVVKVHYSGKLIDGTEFDSSYERNEPATFGVGQVIQGWIEGLQLMTVGSKYKLYIPYNLGYGAQGTSNIPPFSTLVFEVELLEIVKK